MVRELDRRLVRLIRQSYGLTTYDMAKRLDVSLSSYTNFETGYTSSELVPNAMRNRIPRSVIIEAEKLLRLAEAAL